MSLMSRAWRSSTPGLPTLLIPMLGIWDLAAKDQRQLVGKGNRLDARQFGREPAHEAGAIVARAAGRLAELDRVLGLEMAPRQVIGGAGERHEGNLALGPQRIDAVAQGRVQAPLRAERQGGVWIAGIGSGDAERRPRSCDRSRSTPAPRHWRRRRRRARTPPAAAHRWPVRPRRGRRPSAEPGGKRLDQFTAIHGGDPFAAFQRMNSGDDRNSVFQSCGEIA